MKKLFFFFSLTLCIIGNSCKDDPVTQADSGNISGTVKDEASIPVAGVQVTTEPATSSVITDNNGFFSINNVAVGSYKVQALKSSDLSGSTSIAVSSGKTATADIVLHPLIKNKAPNAPNTPFPSLDTILYDNNVTLMWQCTDPENDSLIYDIYIGTDTVLKATERIAQGVQQSSIEVKNLSLGVTYYWRIVANDKKGNTTTSDRWRFHTKDPLILWLPFDTDSKDKSNYSNIVNTSNVRFDADRHSKIALMTQGSVDSHVLVPNDLAFSLNPNQSISVSCWIQFTDIQPEFAGIVGKARSFDAGGFKGWQITILQGSKVSVQYGEGSSFLDQLCDTVTVNDGRWHHIVVVFNRSTRISQIFIDNNLKSQVQSNHLSLDPNTTNPLRIGIERNSVRPFKGKIDDIRLFTKPLSAEEIQLLFSE